MQFPYKNPGVQFFKQLQTGFICFITNEIHNFFALHIIMVMEGGGVHPMHYDAVFRGGGGVRNDEKLRYIINVRPLQLLLDCQITTVVPIL